MKLSDRVRPNSEAAPWVLKEILKLEAELERVKTESEERIADMLLALQGAYNNTSDSKILEQLKNPSRELIEYLLLEVGITSQESGLCYNILGYTHYFLTKLNEMSKQIPEDYNRTVNQLQIEIDLLHTIGDKLEETHNVISKLRETHLNEYLIELDELRAQYATQHDIVTSLASQKKYYQKILNIQENTDD